MNLMSMPRTAMAAPVGLYAHVRSNHSRSLLLFGCFLIAFHLLSVAILTIPLLIFDPDHAPGFGTAGYVARYLLPVSAIGGIMFALRYWWHVSGVRKDTGFHYVDGSDEPRLVRLIEPLIIAAGLRPPFLGVVEDTSMNAFAVGVRDSHNVVVVTRGLIDGLDDEELEAVLAHELMHIRNRDTRLMAAANAFMGSLTGLRGQLLNDKKLEEGGTVVGFIMLPFLLPLLLGLWFLGNLGFRIGYLSRAAISSAREFIADAEAVRLTHNPAALASALGKVAGRERIEALADRHDAMLIVGAVEGPAATHPSIAERIAALVQTTGPAMAYAPQRRDTRPPEQRRRAGFGRAMSGDLTGAVAAAGEARGELLETFRRTRDPDRNMFGLRRRGAMVVWAGAGGALVLWGTLFVATGRSADPRSLITMTDGARMAVRCQVVGYSHLLGLSAAPSGCSSADVDGWAKRYAGQVGSSFQPSGLKAATSGTFSSAGAGNDERMAQIARFQQEHRCFRFQLPVVEHSPPRIDRDVRLTWDLNWYREWAGRKIPGIEAPPPPGQSAAKAYVDYLDMRVRIASFGRYYLGRERFPEIQALFDDPRHQRALALFPVNMRNPRFAAYFRRMSTVPDSVEILATMPDATSCSLRRQELGLATSNR